MPSLVRLWTLAALMLSCGGGDAPVPKVRSFAGVPLDVLILIDDSGSMKEEQMQLAAAFPAFEAALHSKYGQGLDLHVGVVSSDLGAFPPGLVSGVACGRTGGNRGALVVREGCGVDVQQGRFISHTSTSTNYEGTLWAALACMVQLGTGGCGFEHQLQAVAVALGGAAPSDNSGFLRANAGLLILILSDEDDCSGSSDQTLFVSQEYPGTQGSLRCSIEGHSCNGKSPLEMKPFEVPLASCRATNMPKLLVPVSAMADEIKAAKPEGPIAVGVIGGFPLNTAQATYAFEMIQEQPELPPVLASRPLCRSELGSAAAGLRLQQFAELLGGRTYSVCQPNFAEALEDIVKRLP